MQNDTLQNIDCLNLPTPIDLSLDDDTPNKNDVNNSDEQSLFSDSSSTNDLESNTIQAPIILNEDELFLRRAEGHECSICQQENHHLSQIALSTFRHNDGSRACQHILSCRSYSDTNHRSRLHIPAGILRIPVFSVPVALFPQESRFLFRHNLFLPPQKSCLYGANVGCYVGNEFVRKKT